jgi:peroxiredoxin
MRRVPCSMQSAGRRKWLEPLRALWLLPFLAGGVSAASPVPGQPAPDFVLRSLDAGNVRISEFRGEVVVVNFWAAWCGPCQQELPRLDEIHRRYQQAGLVVLAINLDDDVERAQDISRRLSLSFPMLFDPAKDTGHLYQVDSMPMTLLIDREGVVRHVHGSYRADDETLYLKQIRELIDE